MKDDIIILAILVLAAWLFWRNGKTAMEKAAEQKESDSSGSKAEQEESVSSGYYDWEDVEETNLLNQDIVPVDRPTVPKIPIDRTPVPLAEAATMKPTILTDGLQYGKNTVNKFLGIY